MYRTICDCLQSFHRHKNREPSGISLFLAMIPTARLIRRIHPVAFFFAPSKFDCFSTLRPTFPVQCLQSTKLPFRHVSSSQPMFFCGFGPGRVLNIKKREICFSFFLFCFTCLLFTRARTHLWCGGLFPTTPTVAPTSSTEKIKKKPQTSSFS